MDMTFLSEYDNCLKTASVCELAAGGICYILPRCGSDRIERPAQLCSSIFIKSI